jgi:hypothetical protein
MGPGASEPAPLRRGRMPGTAPLGEFSKIVTASLDAGRLGIQRRADGLLEKR